LADRNFNVWWNEMGRDLSRTIVGLNLRHRNFRGSKEELALGGQIGYTRKLTLNYIKPYLDKKQKQGMGAGFAYSENAETFYKTDSNKLLFAKSLERPMRHVLEANVSYSFRPAYHAVHIWKVNYRHITVDDSIVGLNRAYFSNGGRRLRCFDLSYRAEVNKTDNWIYPLVGRKTIFNAVVVLGIEGVDKLAFATLEHGTYAKLKGKNYVSAIFRGKLMVPQAVPYALRQGLGGKYEYVRGYEYYVIDGYQYGLLRGNLKHELISSTSLFRLPVKYLPVVPLRVYPKIFADAGYVTNPQPGNSFLNNRLLYTIGAGVDIITIYDIKLRIEYALNHLGQKGLFLHFSSE
jgi:hypothetical protein